MRLTLRLDRHDVRRWHRDLLGRLEALGADVTVELGTGASRWPEGFPLLERMERALYKLAPHGPATPADPPADAAARDPADAPTVSPDLVIDLSFDPGAPAGATPRLVLLYDGKVDSSAALAAVLDGDTPRLTVMLVGADKPLVSILPGIEDRRSVCRALDFVLSRCADVLCMAIDRWSTGRPAALDLPQGQPPVHHASSMRMATFALRSVADGVWRKLARMTRGEGLWALAWRPHPADEPLPRTWPADGYRVLPVPAGHFHADPFPILHGGQVHVFYEDFPFATRKGVIAMATLQRDGTLGPARTVLDLDVHLSYPFLFAWAGELWMIPETGGRGTVELFRCHRFPDDWRQEAVLLSGKTFGDATLVQNDGAWWLLATTASGPQSTSDTLAVYRASSPLGPWEPHGTQPVLVDAGCARPAGNIEIVQGHLIRPAQDCRTGYGAAITLCRIDALRQDEPFRQTALARLAPPPTSGLTGLHTLNRAGGTEWIDLAGRRAALMAR